MKSIHLCPTAHVGQRDHGAASSEPPPPAGYLSTRWTLSAFTQSRKSSPLGRGGGQPIWGSQPSRRRLMPKGQALSTAQTGIDKDRINAIWYQDRNITSALHEGRPYVKFHYRSALYSTGSLPVLMGGASRLLGLVVPSSGLQRHLRPGLWRCRAGAAGHPPPIGPNPRTPSKSFSHPHPRGRGFRIVNASNKTPSHQHNA